jgi:hypothetical protein
VRLTTKLLGRNGKILAVCIIVVGILIFFSTMVVLNPPLYGRTHWTPIQIAQAVWQEKLPVPEGHFEESLIGIAVIYAMLPLALVATLMSGSRKALRIVSTIGLIPSYLGKFWEGDFLFTFGWLYFGHEHMQRGLTWWILPWIMPALLAVSFLNLHPSTDTTDPYL